MNDYTNELHQLAIKFRVNDEITALIEIERTMSRVMSDHDILINCNIQTISNIIFEMKECMAKSDYLGLADYLDYDLVRAISK